MPLLYSIIHGSISSSAAAPLDTSIGHIGTCFRVAKLSKGLELSWIFGPPNASMYLALRHWAFD